VQEYELDIRKIHTNFAELDQEHQQLQTLYVDPYNKIKSCTYKYHTSRVTTAAHTLCSLIHRVPSQKQNELAEPHL
jgi:hypothetical protein